MVDSGWWLPLGKKVEFCLAFLTDDPSSETECPEFIDVEAWAASGCGHRPDMAPRGCGLHVGAGWVRVRVARGCG